MAMLAGFALLQKSHARLLNNVLVRRMLARRSLRVDQLIINGDFVAAIARWDKADLLNRMLLSQHRFELSDKCFRQTDGSRGVVSSDTEFNGDDHAYLP